MEAIKPYLDDPRDVPHRSMLEDQDPVVNYHRAHPDRSSYWCFVRVWLSGSLPPANSSIAFDCHFMAFAKSPASM